MLSLDQLNKLKEAAAVADSLEDEIDTVNWSQTEIEVDPGDLYQLVETWQFMFEALKSLGYFATVRVDGF